VEQDDWVVPPQLVRVLRNLLQHMQQLQHLQHLQRLLLVGLRSQLVQPLPSWLRLRYRLRLPELLQHLLDFLLRHLR
jgi:hypothetical protein